jgi:hypothetical protein
LSRAISTRFAAAFRRTALPLVSYYAVTLAVPLANGAAQSGGPFAEHAVVVLIVPPLAIVLVCALHGMLHAAVSPRLRGGQR